MAVEQALHRYVVRWLGFHGMHSMPAGKPGEKRYAQFKIISVCQNIVKKRA